MLNLLYLLTLSFLVFGDGLQQTQADVQEEKILFVLSSAEYYGDSDIPASNHFAEIVYPYDVLTKAGYEVDFVSPLGGAVAIGYINTSDPIIKSYIYDCTFMKLLSGTLKPSEVDAQEYGAIYYGGGGASMFGVADNEEIQSIAMKIYEAQGVISSVCHGSYGIANLKTSDGRYLVAGRKVNGFPDIFENKQGKYFEEFDHSVEELLKIRGADFKYSSEGWDSFYQVDGRIITGQDPSSATKVAELIIEQIR